MEGGPFGAGLSSRSRATDAVVPDGRCRNWAESALKGGASGTTAVRAIATLSGRRVRQCARTKWSAADPASPSSTAATPSMGRTGLARPFFVEGMGKALTASPRGAWRAGDMAGRHAPRIERRSADPSCCSPATASHILRDPPRASACGGSETLVPAGPRKEGYSVGPSATAQACKRRSHIQGLSPRGIYRYRH